MILLTEELKKRFARVGRQESKLWDALVIARYFVPWGSWTWYATEYYPKDRIFFGYVCGMFDEWGYFSLDEMQDLKGPMGLGMERDLHYTEKTLREALSEDRHYCPDSPEEPQQHPAKSAPAKPPPEPEPAPYDDIGPSVTVMPCGCEAEEDEDGRLVITCLCDRHCEQRAVE